MTFVQLEIFSMLAQLKSFTAVAKRLNISQSAVSHALKALEQQWNVRLFYRNKNEVELTVLGEELLIYSNDILHSRYGLEQKIAAFNGIRSGTIRIGSFGASSSNVLIPLILEKFILKYPEIEILIEEGTDQQIAQWLIEGKIDIGFKVLPDDRFYTYPIIEDIFVALIPKNYPLAQNNAVSLQQVIEYPFLMTAAGSQEHVSDMFKKANLTPNIKCTFSQILTIINMVNNQMGISIVADMAVDKSILSLYPNVSKHPLIPNVKRSIGLAVKSQNHLSPLLEAFIRIAQSIE
ncbi:MULTISPECIES: LysR family transcriptional regulator [unclassified Acinetobacter]|uniref:LysR family transcriptional regulator n=1 Tax=unclassified Acinetobacter TaxID=196816 RepID=UPI002934935A|nr:MULTISPECIES: LysR family transcriptional regulator [unclassified Acinetobacter]WOE32671.1 LysR family transcriptional regulator [Acinetobacter sp. SAAs470]WOE38147.1 LysR family transcriptional regulator [Acinetobacter sp. SAAs474]